MGLRMGPAIVLIMVTLLASQPAFPTVSGAARIETPTATPAITLAVVPTTAPTVGPTYTPTAVESLPDLSKFVRAKDSEHFSFYVEPDSYALRNLDDFASEAETLLDELNERLDVRPGERMSFYFYGARNRNYSALSFFSPLLIYLEYNGNNSKSRLQAVISHELTHLVTMQTLGYSEDLVHLEGIAQWASEAYWSVAVGESFDKRMRRYLARSATLPLADLRTKASSWRGITQFMAYDQAGSFVGYLIEAYGLGQFKKVYRHSNYEEVYGKSLLSLEADWLAYVNHRG